MRPLEVNRWLTRNCACRKPNVAMKSSEHKALVWKACNLWCDCKTISHSDALILSRLLLDLIITSTWMFREMFPSSKSSWEELPLRTKSNSSWKEVHQSRFFRSSKSVKMLLLNIHGFSRTTETKSRKEFFLFMPLPYGSYQLQDHQSHKSLGPTRYEKIHHVFSGWKKVPHC